MRRTISVLVQCFVLAGCGTTHLAESSSEANTDASRAGHGAPAQPSDDMNANVQEQPAAGVSGGPSGGVGGTPFEENEGAAGEPGLVHTGGSAGHETGGVGGALGIPVGPSCDATEPIVARDGEVCYEFLVHNGQGPGDPFIVPNGESYNQLYYEIPWPEDMVATRFGGQYDKVEVLHQWFAYDLVSVPEDPVQRNTTGTVLFSEATMFAAWSIGSCPIELPRDMGIQLAGPSSGKTLMVQWHHTNFTGVPQDDASVVQICTVPRSERAHIGGVTWLGTENVSTILPDHTGKAGGACRNDTREPITIVALEPHMHRFGTHIVMELVRADASVETIFDQPYQEASLFPSQLDPAVVMRPGDRIRSECSYFNNTSTQVTFGLSAWNEVCFQHAYAYPVGALDKGTASLYGALNTCWGDEY